MSNVTVFSANSANVFGFVDKIETNNSVAYTGYWKDVKVYVSINNHRTIVNFTDVANVDIWLEFEADTCDTSGLAASILMKTCYNALKSAHINGKSAWSIVKSINGRNLKSIWFTKD